MLGGLGNLPGLMKQAKAFQERLATLQQELASRRFECESGGGAVKAVVDGKGLLISVRIQPEAAADVELLEDMVTSAVRAANQKAHDAMRETMTQMTGGINIPGLSDMFGSSGG